MGVLPPGLFPFYTGTFKRITTGATRTSTTLGTMEVHLQPNKGDVGRLPVGNFPQFEYYGIIDGALAFAIHKGDVIEFQITTGASPTYQRYMIIEEPTTLWCGIPHTELKLKVIEAKGEPVA